MAYLPLLLALAGIVSANPVPQGITAAIAPQAAAPSGCAPSYSGTFGIAVLPLTGGVAVPSQRPDGQPAVSQISDGQAQAPAVTQIADGQIQAPVVSQIPDGQIQAPVVTQKPDGQPNAPAVTQKVDGQPNAPAVTQKVDGQPNAPAVTQKVDGQPNAPAVSQIGDGQAQAPAASQLPDGQPQAGGSGSSSGSGLSMVSCMSDSTLALTLKNGILLDSKGRTGYIAANYQFQFDAPAQTGAIYTAGFSICGNGSLALGGSEIFYRCRSGDFYNLYDRYWAPQCEPVTISAVNLVQC